MILFRSIPLLLFPRLLLLLRFFSHLGSIRLPPFKDDGQRKAYGLDTDETEQDAEMESETRNEVGPEGDDLVSLDATVSSQKESSEELSPRHCAKKAPNTGSDRTTASARWGRMTMLRGCER